MTTDTQNSQYQEGTLPFSADELQQTMPAKRKRGRKPQHLPREERPEMTIDEMIGILMRLTEVEGANGNKYTQLHTTRRLVLGVRDSTKKPFSISIPALYAAYNGCHRFTSPEVKKRIYMGHSPALALLRKLKEVKEGKA